MKIEISAKNLPRLTAQQVFDHVAGSANKQKSRSLETIDGRFRCAYRGDNGTKCFAGFILKDEEYECIVQKGVQNSVWQYLVLNLYVPEDHSSLISDLQMIHDTYQVSEWREKLAKVADLFGLNKDVLQLWGQK